MVTNWLWIVTRFVFQGCRPYSFAECEHHVNGSRPHCNVSATSTPDCVEQCDEGYTVSYQDDKQFGKFILYYVAVPFLSANQEIGYKSFSRMTYFVLSVTLNLTSQS